MMWQEYSWREGKDAFTYEFESVGPKGTILKVVLLQWLHTHNVYNFAFGDWDTLAAKIVDAVRSNNNDVDRIMATLGSILLHFTGSRPKCRIFFKGLGAARTRLYQQYINHFWEQIVPLFAVQGFRDGGWESFMRGANYEAFLIWRREAPFHF